MGFLDFFTVVLTYIWRVHREHRFSWNHCSCISCRNFASRLRIMIWLLWRERASMHDEMLGSHLIHQNTLCETQLTASSDPAWCMTRGIRLDTETEVCVCVCVWGGGLVSLLSKKRKKFFYWHKPCQSQFGNGGTASDTSFICTEWMCRNYKPPLRRVQSAKGVTQWYKLMHLKYKQ